jgi:hypothetical protein
MEKKVWGFRGRGYMWRGDERRGSFFGKITRGENYPKSISIAFEWSEG